MSTYSGGYAGKITLTDATVESDNTVYADLSMMVGPENIAATAADMGITSPVGDNPSIALGGLTTGVSPLEMADAYATLATGGERLSGTMLADDEPAPISISRVTDSQGHVLVRNTLVRARALQPWQAGLETSILQQVIERGTGQAAAIGRPAAGKTGTTTNFADAWFCGYTPDLAAAVWVGYPGSQREMIVRGIRVAGGTFPAMIWNRFAAAALTGVPAHAFPSFKLPPVTKRIVCSRSGDLATRWCPERLKCFYFAAQGPGQSCTFHGPQSVSVPDLTGLRLAAARGPAARGEARLAGGLRARRPRPPGDRPRPVAGRRPDDPSGDGRHAAHRQRPAARRAQRRRAVPRRRLEELRRLGLCRPGALRRRDGRSARHGHSQQPAAGTSGQGTVTIFVHGSDVDRRRAQRDGPDRGRRPGRSGCGRAGVRRPAGETGGPVVSQTPAAGDKLEIGGLVQLTLGPGPSPTTSP